MSDEVKTQTFQIAYGTDQSIEFTIPQERVSWQHFAPEALENPVQAIQEALATPIDFPPISQAVIPDDCVAIAAEIDTPGLELIIAEVCAVLGARGVLPENMAIVQEAGGKDPRRALPEEIRERVIWLQHDPTDKDSVAYLAATTSGERIQLARAITEADVVLSIGRIGFDPLLGFRGTNSAFYPSLSTTDAIEKARGQGHSELQPEDGRPLRQIVDEVCWLLGSQFTIQTIPAAGNGIAQVLAGAVEPAFRKGKEYLADELLVTPDERADLVVVSVGNDAGGHGWTQVAGAIATARRLVTRDGKILVLSQVSEEFQKGLQILRLIEDASEAIKPLRLEAPTDLVPATQIASAVQWADVYLLSDSDSDLIEDIFMFPLGEVAEAVKLVENTEGSIILIEDAHNVHGRIAE